MLLSLNEKEATRSFNLDELFEKRRQQNLQQKSAFDKILRRIYDRIKATSRMKPDEQYIFYQVPYMLWGISSYKYEECIAYLSCKLTEDGFTAKYVPELWLFISWANYVPSYVRSELRQKTGIVVDEHGKIVHIPDAIKGQNERQDPNLEPHVLPNGRIVQQPKKKAEFIPTARYKPKGELVYGPERFDQIERRVTFQTDTASDNSSLFLPPVTTATSPFFSQSSTRKSFMPSPSPFHRPQNGGDSKGDGFETVIL